MILHAGLVAYPDPGGWRGVLISGVSGAGKSDLALRLLDQGFVLVADDRTLVWTSGGAVYGRAPQALAGLIEVRGQGVLAQAFRSLARIVLVARCTTEPIERLPDPVHETLVGTPVPAIDFHPLEASAPAKLRRALSALG